MTESKVDNCRLCNEKRELKASHYLPAGAFKALLRAREPYSNDYLTLSADKSKAVTSNKQITKHALCAECEGKFNQYGEDIVLPELNRSGRFTCRDELLKCDSYVGLKGMPFYTLDIAGDKIDFKAYLYFALSVFWRGAAIQWDVRTSHYYGSLRHRYKKQIRRYLLDPINPPKDIFIWAEVDLDNPPDATLSYPDVKMGLNDGLSGMHHRFVVPGIIFRLFFDFSQMPWMHDLSMDTGHPGCFSACSFRGHQLSSPLEKMFRQATPIGRAEKLYEAKKVNKRT